jgi:hypothetical protein
MLKGKINRFLFTPISIAPLITFRVIFGALMLFGVLRFWSMNWIEELYIQPKVHFPFFGLDFIQALPGKGMYIVFALMGIAAFNIMIGAFYRLSSTIYFLLFTYVELIDITTYLNHYYFVSLVAFWMIFVPANGAYSVDVLRKESIRKSTVSRWTIFIFQFQLAVVYFFAGIAKINADWMFRAMPMSIWLPARANMPIIGQAFQWSWVPFVFSWCGLLYDLFIPFLLWWKRSRPWAYIAVLVFHILTWCLFQIGVFPWVMIGLTLIFFSPTWHLNFWQIKNQQAISTSLRNTKLIGSAVIAYFFIQLILPFRYAAFPSNLFWKEQGYRFSWRVMLMEKAGSITYTVKDLRTDRKSIVDHQSFLTPLQEKQMSTQPDMIYKTALLIEEMYREQGLDSVAVYAESYVTLNGSGSRPFVKRDVDLLSLKNPYLDRSWVHDWE